MGIHETLGEDSRGICWDLQGFTRIHGDSFGRGFMWGFVRLWERICGDFVEMLGEDSQDFGRGFMGIRET